MCVRVGVSVFYLLVDGKFVAHVLAAFIFCVLCACVCLFSVCLFYLLVDGKVIAHGASCPSSGHLLCQLMRLSVACSSYPVAHHCAW